MQFNINDLVYQAQQKDLSAFSKLYCMSFKDTYYFALRFAGDENTALELVKRIYKKAFNNIANLKQPENFEVWMNFIATGICVDYMKEEERLDFSAVTLPDDFEPIDDGTEFLPQGVENAEKVSLAINKIVDTLPDTQRAAVMLYYFNEMTTKRIAGFIGCSEEDAANTIQAARFNIKAEMERMLNRKTAQYPMEQAALLTTIMQGAKEQTVAASELVKSIFDEATADMPEQIPPVQEESDEFAQMPIAPEKFETVEAEPIEEEQPSKPNSKRIALICVAATLMLIAFIATMGLIVAELTYG